MERDEFNTQFDDPRQWFSIAEQHLEAAHILWVEMTAALNSMPEGTGMGPRALACHRGYLAQLAVAAENAIKAVLIKQRRHRTGAGAVSGKFKHHDLLELCDLADLVPDSYERNVLAKLTEYATWAGRFRFPLNHESMRTAISRGIHSAGLQEYEYLQGFMAKIKPLAGWTEARGWPPS